MNRGGLPEVVPEMTEWFTKWFTHKLFGHPLNQLTVIELHFAMTTSTYCDCGTYLGTSTPAQISEIKAAKGEVYEPPKP